MRNALEEFKRTVGDKKILCAHIIMYKGNKNKERIIILKQNYSNSDLHLFYRELDLTYDDEYCEQKLFGTIWADNNIWFSRPEDEEYERWISHDQPPIHNDCITN